MFLFILYPFYFRNILALSGAKEQIEKKPKKEYNLDR